MSRGLWGQMAKGGLGHLGEAFGGWPVNSHGEVRYGGQMVRELPGLTH